MALQEKWENYEVHGVVFKIPATYSLREPVGQGAYGMVCAAQDNKRGGLVAIKKVDNAFEHTTFAKRLLRELRILRYMEHENVIVLREVILPQEREFEDLYVVTDLMETDLASILKSPQELTGDHCQFLLYQLLRGMKYIHSASVVHRDIKPRNLLVNANCDLKICDFGLARLLNVDYFPVGPMTEYVCTRWYRAPELLCSRDTYSTSVDVWSIGCVFAELLDKKPLFPGHDTKDQLTKVVEVVGKPSRQEIAKIPNSKCRDFVNGLKDTQSRLGRFKNASPAGLALLQLMLVFTPEDRASVTDALQHPFMEELHCQDDEPSRTPLDPREFEFEGWKLTMEAIRADLWIEVLSWHRHRKTELEEAKHSLAVEFTRCRKLVEGESPYSDEETP